MATAQFMVLDRNKSVSVTSSSVLMAKRFERYAKAPGESLFSVPRSRIKFYAEQLGVIALLRSPDYDLFPIPDSFSMNAYFEDATDGHKALADILNRSQSKSFELILLSEIHRL